MNTDMRLLEARISTSVLMDRNLTSWKGMGRINAKGIELHALAEFENVDWRGAPQGPGLSGPVKHGMLGLGPAPVKAADG
jgi:hypothetical protein